MKCNNYSTAASALPLAYIVCPLAARGHDGLMGYVAQRAS